MITITKKAQQQLEKNPHKKDYLRLRIIGEGCNGNHYELQFTDKKTTTEETIKAEGITLLINKQEKKKLEGTTIDYIKKADMEGYHITNKQIIGGCHGCSCKH